MKIAVGALGVITQGVNKEGMLQLPTLGEPWGERTLWKDVTKYVPATKRFLAQIGIVRVFSAFEDLLVGVKAEHDRWIYASNVGVHVRHSQEEVQEIALLDLYHQLGWTTSDVDPVMPVLDYLVQIRNCIVHRSGRASKALEALASSKNLQECLESWHGSNGKHVPPLPSIAYGKEMPLLPRHSVFAVEVCYRIALNLNERLRDLLGEEGFVYMAVHHALLSEDRIATGARKSPHALIHALLFSRYRVEDASDGETIRVLKRIGKWNQCRMVFSRRYPEARF